MKSSLAYSYLKVTIFCGGLLLNSCSRLKIHNCHQPNHFLKKINMFIWVLQTYFENDFQNFSVEAEPDSRDLLYIRSFIQYNKNQYSFTWPYRTKMLKNSNDRFNTCPNFLDIQFPQNYLFAFPSPQIKNQVNNML